jgi:hypothetical protein
MWCAAAIAAAGQPRITEVGLDEGMGLGQLRTPPGMRRYRALVLQRAGQRRGQHVEREGGQPGDLGRAELVHAPSQLQQKLG